MSWCGKDMAVKDGNSVVWWVVTWRSIQCWFVRRVWSQNSLMRGVGVSELSFLFCLHHMEWWDGWKRGVPQGRVGSPWAAGLELRALNSAVGAAGKKVCPYILYKHRNLMCCESRSNAHSWRPLRHCLGFDTQHWQLSCSLQHSSILSAGGNCCLELNPRWILFPLFSILRGCLFLSCAQLLGTYPNLAGHWEPCGMIRGVLAVASLVLHYQTNQWVMELEPAGVFHCQQQREALTPSLLRSPKQGHKECLKNECYFEG